MHNNKNSNYWRKRQEKEKVNYTSKNDEWKNSIQHKNFKKNTTDTKVTNTTNHNTTITNSNECGNVNLNQNNNNNNSNNIVIQSTGRSKYIQQIMNSIGNLKQSVSKDSRYENPLFNQNALKKNSKYCSTSLFYEEKLDDSMKTTGYEAKETNVTTDELVATKYDSDIIENTGNLIKLQIMTAADFNKDRYARFAIHEMEIKDYVRTITYKNCIEHCADNFIEDKVVLVIRSGIGLLPMLCVRLGRAKKVIGLEKSDCIEYARRIVEDNAYSHVITLIQSSVDDLKKLPHGLTGVDVIISDFMGECVLSQGDEMEEVIRARNRFLKPNGIMIPMCVTMYCHLLEQRRAYLNQRIYQMNNNKKHRKPNSTHNETLNDFDDNLNDDSTSISWWKNVYGFDMRSKAQFIVDSYSENGENDDQEWCVMSEPLVQFFDPYKVTSSPGLIKVFDMYNCTIEEVRLVQCKDLKLKCITPFTSANGGDYAHMLELFMVVDFPDGQNVNNVKENTAIGFSTSCYSPHTRYRQTGLLLRDELVLEKDDIFIINDFRIWRGPNQHKADNETINTLKSSDEENLKLRLKYTFVNKHMEAIDRRCAYTLIKHLF